MPTAYVRADRAPWFVDFDGVQAAFKNHDATDTFGFDWSRFLGDDTIAASTWTLSGALKNNSDSNTTTTTTISISGTDGEAKNTITTVGEKTYHRTLRFYAADF